MCIRDSLISQCSKSKLDWNASTAVPNTIDNVPFDFLNCYDRNLASGANKIKVFYRADLTP